MKKRELLKQMFEADTPPHPVNRISMVTNPETGAAQLVEAGHEQPPPATHSVTDTTRSASKVPTWSLTVAGAAVGAVGQSLSKAHQEQADIIDSLKQQLASGEAIVEIDPAQIGESFVIDRMEISDEATNILAEQIKEQGQIVPILVRPHPDSEGRYQIAYGHRRVRAAALLGIKVRAIIRNLSDAELVIAQGQENNAREDLSFIEKAVFAVKLQERGFDRKIICAAIAVSKSDCSTLIKIGSRIPRSVIEAIGKAPGVGRPRWNELLETIQERHCADRAIEILADPKFLASKSDDRFHFLFQKLNKQELSQPIREQSFWSDPMGRRIATISLTDAKCTLQIDRRDEPGFAKFLIEKLNDLYRDYEASKAS